MVMKRLVVEECPYCKHRFVHSRWCTVGRSFVTAELVRANLNVKKTTSAEIARRVKVG
jgi:hypothetical protein